MKKIIILLFLSMVVVFSAEAHKYKNRNTQGTISIQTFYDQLSPYGDWISSPDYGYVWRPYFDNPESFRPYSSNGNWVYTDYGWTWASGYDWGWATFHYGRWDFDNYLGWMWIPGYEWAPAWVSWGSYDNYWGWAPMGPNIYVQSNWYAPDPWWTFVPQNQFCSSNWNRYIYNRPVHVTNITHITNVYVDANNHNNRNSWYNGPRVNDVERYSKSRVRKMEVNESQRPDRAGVHNNRLDVYRPTVEKKRNDSRPSEYRNVEQARSGKRIEQTNARTNNPGMNRTRDSRTEIRGSNQAPAQRNGNVKNETRVEPRSSPQAPNERKSEINRNSRETPRTSTQPDVRKATTNENSRVEHRNGSQASPDRNSNRSPVETRSATPDRENNSRVNENKQPTKSQPRSENRVNSETRSNVPSRENVNNNSSRGSVNNQATKAEPTREKRTQNTAPASSSRGSVNNQATKAEPTRETRTQNDAPATNSRSEKTEIERTKREDAKQDVNKASDKNREKRSSRGPTSR